MITKEIVDFIKSELGKGKTREQITHDLSSGGGWSLANINEAFIAINAVTPSNVPQSPIAPPVIASTPPPASATSTFKPISVPVIHPSSKLDFIRNPRTSVSFLMLLIVSLVSSLLVLASGSLTGNTLPAQGLTLVGLMTAVLFIVLFINSVILNITTRILKIENRSLAKSIVFSTISLLASCIFSLLASIDVPELIIFFLGSLASVLLFVFIYQTKFFKSLGALVLNIVFSGIFFGLTVLILSLVGIGFLSYFTPSNSSDINIPDYSSLNQIPVQTSQNNNQPASDDQVASILAVLAALPIGIPLPEDLSIVIAGTEEFSGRQNLTFPVDSIDVWKQKYDSFFVQNKYTKRVMSSIPDYESWQVSKDGIPVSERPILDMEVKFMKDSVKLIPEKKS